MTAPEIENRILGARIVAVEQTGIGMVRIEFAFKGTDDGNGWIHVPAAQIHFESDEKPDHGLTDYLPEEWR